MKYTVHPGKGRITANTKYSSKQGVFAADDDDDDLFGPGMDEIQDDEDFTDTLDDVADTVQDIQDVVDEVSEDDVDIEMDNNIADHYIAECEACGGVFISAVIHSDQEVEKISGVCPLCEKESDQYLRWIIKEVGSDEVEE